jgi:hypothetical protein
VVPGGRVSGPNLDRVLAISTPDDVYACDELLNVEEGLPQRNSELRV